MEDDLHNWKLEFGISDKLSKTHVSPIIYIFNPEEHNTNIASIGTWAHQYQNWVHHGSLGHFPSFIAQFSILHCSFLFHQNFSLQKSFLHNSCYIHLLFYICWKQILVLGNYFTIYWAFCNFPTRKKMFLTFFFSTPKFSLQTILDVLLLEISP